jgi:DNA polymerase III alpha subunit
MPVIPIFRTTYCRKGLWTLEKPGKSSDEGPPSIFDAAQKYNLPRIVILDDEMIGCKKAIDTSKELGLELIFGVRFSICNDKSAEDKKTSAHKINIFALNDDGVRELMKIYSAAHTESEGFLDYSFLAKNWSSNLELAVPFYDSFIHRNNFYLQNCIPQLDFARPTFFLENNSLAIDEVLRRKTIKFAADKFPTQEVKTIYYEKREDLAAFCTYKIITDRKMGKHQTLEKPELEGFSSAEFCMESFCEIQDSKI